MMRLLMLFTRFRSGLTMLTPTCATQKSLRYGASRTEGSLGWTACRARTATLFFALCLPLSHAHAATLSTVVLTGDTAPDTGDVFQYFVPPLVNDSGEVLVVGGNALVGAWIAGDTSLDTVVLNGDLDPLTGLTLGPLQAGRIGNDGSASAFHPATESSVTYDSIWRGAPGSYDLVAIEDEDGDPFNSILNEHLLFDDGSVGISVTNATFPFPRGYYVVASGGGPAVLVAQELAPAPGTSTTFEDLPVFFAGNEVGGIFFLGEVVAPSANDDGLWVGTSASLTLVAREGDLVPGLGSETYTGFNNLRLADTGEVGFGFVTSSGTRGIMTGTPGNLSIAVKTDDLAPVPGETDADYLAFQNGGSQMSGSGDLVFVATVAGMNINSSNSETIFSIIDDVVALEAREGDLAPGAGGATFTGLDTPMINDLGQVVFTADTSDGESGIWISEDTGLELIARTGDFFDVGGGDLREILDFGLRTESQFQEGALGDGGHVAFQLYFGDGSSGLFEAVPEPSFGIGLLLGATLIAGARPATRSGRRAPGRNPGSRPVRPDRGLREGPRAPRRGTCRG